MTSATLIKWLPEKETQSLLPPATPNQVSELFDVCCNPQGEMQSEFTQLGTVAFDPNTANHFILCNVPLLHLGFPDIQAVVCECVQWGKWQTLLPLHMHLGRFCVQLLLTTVYTNNPVQTLH